MTENEPEVDVVEEAPPMEEPYEPPVQCAFCDGIREQVIYDENMEPVGVEPCRECDG